MSGALRLLAVLAHPDDESLGFGGVLAKYAAEGVETAVVTATRGDAGRYRGVKEGEGPEHPGREALARIREGELRAAAALLGVRHLALLGYPDGALDRVDAVEATGRIADEIRRLRPHVVVSFGPDGAYGHPDHIAVSQLAGAAIVAAASTHAVSKFYSMAMPEGAMAAYQAAFKKLTSLVDGVERQAHPWPDWAITTVVDTREQWETVWKAVACHDSQIAAYQRLRELSPEHHEALWGRQYYYRVFSSVNGGRRRETDLFEGLRP
ncbi:MAG TPA: PIG-L family deacetylase [Candidatus Eisenbacteria bacterium]|nr:PIG-L family deacetylase [Candidatus Eisenbacteria bacterium]